MGHIQPGYGDCSHWPTVQEERWEQKMEVLYYLSKTGGNTPLKRLEQVTSEALGFRRNLRSQGFQYSRTP